MTTYSEAIKIEFPKSTYFGLSESNKNKLLQKHGGGMMLKAEDNELLVRVTEGTPMGSLLRRFWVPALTSEEIQSNDGPPVRVNILGMKLVAFRDSEGRIGLLDAYCPHRRANLFWGRNEECGLRCVYHGWKFDVDGNCVDIPNAARGSRIKNNVKISSYPVLERGGMVWAYFGPDLPPPFPHCEIFDLPAGHRYVQKVVLQGNWFQFMEGDIDSSHVSFLHSRVDKKSPVPDTFIAPYNFSDPEPVLIAKATDYGMILAARRDASPTDYSWRITQWLMPFTSLIAAQKTSAFQTNIRVPIDDNNTMHLRIFGRIDKPLTEQDWAIIRGGILFPEMIPGTFTTKANISNDYLIDRERQKTELYTGIESVPVQDYAVVQDQGGTCIADRSREFLIESDAAIIAVRNRILKTTKALMDGIEPPEASSPKAYRVRSIDFLAPKETDLLTAIEEVIPEYGPVSVKD